MMMVRRKAEETLYPVLPLDDPAFMPLSGGADITIETMPAGRVVTAGVERARERECGPHSFLD